MDDLRVARVEMDVGARSSAVMYTACHCSGLSCWPWWSPRIGSLITSTRSKRS